MTPSAAIKERPILFNAEMVRAILDGSKTQTRRVVNWPKPAGSQDPDHPHDLIVDGWPEWHHTDYAGLVCSRPLDCPYGVPGDRLWLRETWLPCYELCASDGVWYPADGEYRQVKRGKLPPTCKLTNRARMPKGSVEIVTEWLGKKNISRRPSIHMPRWASRVLLEVTDVRVERVQDIRDKDVLAEGIDPLGPEHHWSVLKKDFKRLWDSVAKPGERWADNPWVWAVEFRVIEGGGE